jgi:hypothetical protein
MKVRYMVLLVGLAFAVTLAVIVGQRLSAEAMAVVVGVVAGVASSIPTSLIVVWVTTRTLNARSAIEAERRVAAPPPAAAPEPRVVVLTQPAAPQPQAWSPYLQTPYMPLPAYPVEPRRFTVIGGEAIIPPETAAEAEPAEVIWQR